MLTQNQIRLINSLEVKKYRQANGLFVVEGEKMVAEFAANGIETDHWIVAVESAGARVVSE